MDPLNTNSHQKMVDYVKSLDEFIDICNTGKSEVDKVWPNQSKSRILVRQCVAILTRLAYPNDNEKIFKADWLYINEAIQSLTFGGNVDELIAWSKKYAEHGNLFYPYKSGDEAIIENIRDLCLGYATLEDNNKDMLENLLNYQKTWFPFHPTPLHPTSDLVVVDETPTKVARID